MIEESDLEGENLWDESSFEKADDSAEGDSAEGDSAEGDSAESESGSELLGEADAEIFSELNITDEQAILATVEQDPETMEDARLAREFVAGSDQAWSDAELQAAMRAFWSSYSDGPNWAVWVLFAGTGRKLSLAGSMFDDSDANQRQGLGVFNDAPERFIESGYPQRTEHVRRERFFSLCHEAGHCFNLHHAWLFFNSDLQWPFYDDTGDSATFMNYPNMVFDFYRKFRYTFHDSDLKFLRHAPDQFVGMGDYRFRGGQDEFGREAKRTLPPWTLGLDLHRSGGVFEFLEPVTLTATLTNTSSHPQLVDESVLEDADNFGLLITKGEDGPSRFWRPFVRHCFRAEPTKSSPTTQATMSSGLSKAAPNA